MESFADGISAFIAIGLPVLAVFGWLTLKTLASHRTERLKLELELVRERKAAQAEARDTRIAERVAVLERILTEPSTRVADEIERLRDTPLN